MQYEVELKFRLKTSEAIYETIAKMGEGWKEPVEQIDSYFKHPVRDFAQTDEALRIRSVGDENRITYKGPVIDEQVKTRQEIEVLFATGNSNREQVATILTILGFEEVRVVKKKRSTTLLLFENFKMEIAFDKVEGLGTFLEIETLADDTTRQKAQEAVLNFAAKLQLNKPEKRSYLCMLLEQE